MSQLFQIRRTWTPAEADEWTKEDVYAVALGVLCFVSVAFGTPYTLLLRPLGFAILGAAVLMGLLMLWIIGPKLDAVSEEYEQKQKHYLERLEKIMRWEDIDG